MKERGQDPAGRDGPAIGLVICCHGSMGRGMREAAEMICGPADQLAVVGVLPGQGLEQVTAALVEAVREVDCGRGVLVLADMPGGTPFNAVLAGLGRDGPEVVAGFNLPALLKALSSRGGDAPAADLARAVADHGGRHLVRGADLLGRGADGEARP
jgi:mannose/fructose/sorbose-specific phosphotransferase system IIA component